MKVHIRWMIRRDMPEVLAIENASFPWPWSEEDYVQALRQRNVIGRVAEWDQRVVGVMVYELDSGVLRLLSVAVHPDFRRRGVGRRMIGELTGRVELPTSHHRRLRGISLEVLETNLAAQYFFHACGFRAMAVLRDFYEASDRDAYHMIYRPPEAIVQNRIGHYFRGDSQQLHF